MLNKNQRKELRDISTKLNALQFRITNDLAERSPKWKTDRIGYEYGILEELSEPLSKLEDLILLDIEERHYERIGRD